MRRADVLQHFVSLRDDEPVVVGPSGSTTLVQAYGDDELFINGMDMPYSTPVCLGLALALKHRRIVAVEGDGSMLAGAAVLSTIARYKPPNLVVLVFDNEGYVSPGHGDIQTATAFGTDIGGMARAAGIAGVRTVRTLRSAKAALDEAFREPGPWVIVAKIDQSDREDPFREVGRTVDIVESAMRFRRALTSESQRDRSPTNGR